MSNTSKGRGTKGSKFWMQVVVENSNLRDELDNQIGESLEWLSPLAGNNEEFLEYKLNQKVMLDKLGITEEEGKNIFSFWPNNQPQWDGLAISKDGETLYLVEAKAHLSELNSKLSATNPTSVKQITNTMREVHKEYFASGNFEAWTDKYYQLANRLTFLKKLQLVRFPVINKVKLVLLNFVDDFTNIETQTIEWEAHYKKVFNEMIGTEKAPLEVIVVNYNVSNRGIAPNPQTGK